MSAICTRAHVCLLASNCLDNLPHALTSASAAVGADVVATARVGGPAGDVPAGSVIDQDADALALAISGAPAVILGSLNGDQD